MRYDQIPINATEAVLCIRIFNNLPDYVKGLINKKQAFKNALERFLLDNIFYSINDYLNYSTDNFKNHNK